MERHGCVAVFYAIQPKNKELQKQLRKLTGLKQSKKHPKIPTYEVCIYTTSILDILTME